VVPEERIVRRLGLARRDPQQPRAIIDVAHEAADDLGRPLMYGS